MNLNSIQPPATATTVQPAGRRLDITLADPAAPNKKTRPDPVPASQVGSIQNVLTSEENQAIAALFGASKQAYSANGGAHRQSVPGLSLDIQA